MDNKAKYSKLTYSLILLFVVVIIIYQFIKANNKNLPVENISVTSTSTNLLATSTVASTTATSTAESEPSASTLQNETILSEPISGALTRVTKKPFGVYITPQKSPVSPERFMGYHTGVDFETTTQEQNIDVPIYTVCAGPLVLKKTATGYGGVAVQSCELNKESVTIIYGHLRLSSITVLPQESLTKGEQIGILGKGYSTETSGERKHLHLGIHKGEAISLLGYVSSKNDLEQWLDAVSLMK